MTHSMASRMYTYKREVILVEWEGVPHAVQGTKDWRQLRVAFCSEDGMIETTAHSCPMETALQQLELLSVSIRTWKEMELNSAI